MAQDSQIKKKVPQRPPSSHKFLCWPWRRTTLLRDSPNKPTLRQLLRAQARDVIAPIRGNWNSEPPFSPLFAFKLRSYRDSRRRLYIFKWCVLRGAITQTHVRGAAGWPRRGGSQKRPGVPRSFPMLLTGDPRSIAPAARPRPPSRMSFHLEAATVAAVAIPPL